MGLWLLIALISSITLVALILAGRKASSVGSSEDEIEKTDAHFKLQLEGIEQDLLAGKLNSQDAEVAKSELARELLRHRSFDSKTKMFTHKSRVNFVLWGTSLATVATAVGVYLLLGAPNYSALPNEQVSQQAQIQTQVDFDQLLLQVEAQMLADPSDINGWRVLGPAYVRAARYDEAINAYRKILELAPPTADAQTDLAEALLLAGDGQRNDEVLSLLNSATLLDPTHTRSRFYLAAEATRLENWDAAVEQWNELLALGKEGDQWIATAQNGLAIAMARGQTPQSPPENQNSEQEIADQAELITSMVARLDARLNAEGGTIEEWTQLVRSNLVMNDIERAKENYLTAVTAFPDENTRLELDGLAAQAGLETPSE